MTEEKKILDATCGGRSIWTKGNKHREDVIYIDKRQIGRDEIGKKNRSYEIQPDRVEDFRDLPFESHKFDLIVFDPPHLLKKDGEPSGTVQEKYGVLPEEEWKEIIREGFIELWRCLKPGGCLNFKFSDRDIYWSDLFEVIPVDPLYGTTTKQRSQVENRWFTFYKERGDWSFELED